VVVEEGGVRRSPPVGTEHGVRGKHVGVLLQLAGGDVSREPEPGTGAFPSICWALRRHRVALFPPACDSV